MFTRLLLSALLLTTAALPLAAAWGGSPDCDNRDVLTRSYRIEGKDGIVMVVTDLTGNTQQGDKVTATLELAPECSNHKFSLVSYEAPGPTFSRDTAHLQKLFDWDTNASRGRGVFTLVLGPIHIPDCYYQIDLVRGEPLRRLGPADSDNFYGDQGRLLDADNGGRNSCTPPPPREPPCPTNLHATANKDESITLRWTAAAGADGYRVYRDSGAGMVRIAQTNASTTMYTDTTTVAGQTYTYMVTSVAGDAESKDCGKVEVTAVPFFGSGLLSALALVGAVGALVVMRRRS